MLQKCIDQKKPKNSLSFNGNIRVGIAFDVYTEDFFTRFNMSTPTNLKLIG